MLSVSSKNNYTGMARIISDVLYARLVKNLMQQEPVQLFNDLIRAEKTGESGATPAGSLPDENTDEEKGGRA